RRCVRGWTAAWRPRSGSRESAARAAGAFSSSRPVSDRRAPGSTIRSVSSPRRRRCGRGRTTSSSGAPFAKPATRAGRYARWWRRWRGATSLRGSGPASAPEGGRGSAREPRVGETRHLATDPGEVVEVDRRRHDAVAVAGPREHPAPGIDDAGVAEVRHAVRTHAGLVRGEEVALVLDRARPAEHFPVRGSGGAGEGGGDEEDLCAPAREAAVELREAQVVAHREPEGPDRGGDHDHVLPRSARFRLAHGDPAGEVDVEEMDLPVAPDQLAVRGEEAARVE